MIQSIRLQHFRSYKDASFEFGEGVNIVVGPNGSGKTNLLEAIMCLSGSESYRADEADLVEFNEDWLRLDAHLRGDRDRVLKIQKLPRLNKTYEIDGATRKRLGDDQKLQFVLFEPNHLRLLHGSPELRRNYLDNNLAQTDSVFEKTLKHYKRTLLQRNRLLKRGRVSSNEMFPWDVRLSDLGSIIAKARSGLVDYINESIAELYASLANSQETVVLKYDTKFPIESYESAMLKTLSEKLDHDVERGFTAYGPHREDMLVEFAKKPVVDVASRGETRTLILALKIIEMKRLEKLTGVKPFILLDDVFSELDGARRRSLTDYLKNHQTFITTTDADVVIKHFDDSTIIPLSREK